MIGRADEIAKQLGGKLGKGVKPYQQISRFVLKAWNMRRSDIFVPILDNANNMIFRAEERNGIVLTDDRKLCKTTRYILVDDVDEAIKRFAIAKRGEFTGEIIGITGSAGKSTTKSMLATVLKEIAPVFSTVANQNLTTFTAASLATMDPDAKYGIFELAMYDSETVKQSAILARPTIAMFTSIGMNHAENVGGTMDDIIMAKTAIFDEMVGEGMVFLPSHDASFEALKKRAEASKKVKSIVPVGLRDDDYVQILDYQENPTGAVVKIRLGQETLSYEIGEPGYHFALNSLLVAAFLGKLGLDRNAIQALKNYETPASSIVRYRMNFKDGRTVEIFDDAIISSPHQVEALLDILVKRKDAKRKVLVFGDMTALGEQSQALHEGLAEKIDEAGFDLVITAGPHSAKMAEKLKTPNEVYPTTSAAAKEIVSLIEDGDLVAIKASGPTKMKFVTKKIYAEGSVRRARDWTVGQYLDEQSKSS